MRSLQAIANEILDDWKKPYFGAVPYINAMLSMLSMDSMYGHETARTIVLTFLSNAATWRGEVARRVKKELKDMLDKHQERT